MATNIHSLVLPRLALSCLVLSCHILSCLVLSCLVWSGLGPHVLRDSLRMIFGYVVWGIDIPCLAQWIWSMTLRLSFLPTHTLSLFWLSSSSRVYDEQGRLLNSLADLADDRSSPSTLYPSCLVSSVVRMYSGHDVMCSTAV